MTKRVLITGASSGIGRVTAQLLAAQGHALALVARRAGVLARVAEDCRSRGAREVVTLTLDLAETERAGEAAAALGGLGAGEPVLVSNAGYGEFGATHEQSFAQIARQVEVNLLGPMAVTHAVLPLMLAHGGGQIVNVLSITVQNAFPGTAGYSAAKAGLDAFAGVVSAEYRRRGIRVTNVVPGATDTPIWDGAGSHPPREDMLPADAVAQAIADVVALPADRVVERVVVTPPKGVL